MYGWLWTCQLRVGRNVARTVSRGSGSKRDVNTQNNALSGRTANLGGREKAGGVEDECFRLLQGAAKQT
jgi:hypothetical protein